MHYIDIFLDYEKEHNLLSKNIGGFYYWGYIRFKLYSNILNEKEGLQYPKKIRNRNIIKHVVKSLTLKNPFFAKKSGVNYLVFQHPRKIKEGLFYKCIYTDNILDYIESSSVIFERDFEGEHYTPSDRDAKYLDPIIIFSYLISRFVSKKKITSQIETEVKQIILDLNNIFHTSIDPSEFADNTVGIYKRWLIQKRMMKTLINKYQPKCIIEVVYYSLSNLIINEIARELNITTVELQHGTMGNYHIAYNFSEKINAPYLPDKIFMFSNYWKQNTRLPQDSDDLIVTGFPYIESKINEFTNINSAIEEREEYTIIFISQLTIGELLSKFIVELVKEIDEANIGYKIIYKLHGSEYSTWRMRYPWLLEIQDQIHIVDNNNISIYEYFVICDAQVGVYSTALFEGLAFGLKTFIVDAYGVEYMQDLLDDKLAELIKSPKELLNFIDKEKKDLINKEVKFKDRNIWEPHSINNILVNLNKIINK